MDAASYITLPGATYGASDLTYSLWVHFRARNQWGRVMGASSGSDHRHQLILWDTSGRLRFYVNYEAGGFLTITTASQVPLNSWVYLAVVFSGPVVSMYFDGALVGSVTPPAGVLQVD
eukprot:3764556-Rhodomonas_salina.1